MGGVGDHHPQTTRQEQQLAPMYKQVVNIEIENETLAKLDQLAAESGRSRDELINESLETELDAFEPANA